MSGEDSLREWIGRMIDTIPPEAGPDFSDREVLESFIRAKLTEWLDKTENLHT